LRSGHKVIFDDNKDSGSVRLTQLSHGSGCGCKLSPDELDSILAEAFPKGEEGKEYPKLMQFYDQDL